MARVGNPAPDLFDPASTIRLDGSTKLPPSSFETFLIMRGGEREADNRRGLGKVFVERVQRGAISGCRREVERVANPQPEFVPINEPLRPSSPAPAAIQLSPGQFRHVAVFIAIPNRTASRRLFAQRVRQRPQKLRPWETQAGNALDLSRKFREV